jgi:hypothetical protein
MIILFRYTNKTMGGFKFIKLDTYNFSFVSGVSGATAESYSSHVRVDVATSKNLKEIKESLILAGCKDRGTN